MKAHIFSRPALRRRLSTGIASIALLAAAGCDAMWDTSVDVPLGPGASLGIGVTTPIYSPGYWWNNGWGWGNSWNNGWGNGWNNGWGWGVAAPPRPQPVRPPIRPGNVVRPPQQPDNNWRPPTRPPFQQTPVNKVPTVRPGASASDPVIPSTPVRPGRH